MHLRRGRKRLGVSETRSQPIQQRETQGRASFRRRLRQSGAANPRGGKPMIRRSIRLDALHLNAKQHVLLESVLLAVVHTEVRTIEAPARVGATNLLLEHGMVDTFE